MKIITPIGPSCCTQPTKSRIHSLTGKIADKIDNVITTRPTTIHLPNLFILNEDDIDRGRRSFFAPLASGASCCICRPACVRVLQMLGKDELSMRLHQFQSGTASPGQTPLTNRRHDRTPASPREFCHFLSPAKPSQNRRSRSRQRHGPPHQASVRSNRIRCFVVLRRTHLIRRWRSPDRHTCTKARPNNPFSAAEIGRERECSAPPRALAHQPCA